MRLAPSLFAAFLAASLSVVACGGEPAEEEGSAARPEPEEGDAGSAGKGGSAAKGGSSGKGGGSGKGGSASKGGSGGTGGDGGSASGSAGSSSGASGASSGAAGSSSGAGGNAGASGSGGSSAGQSGSAGSASGAGGSAGSSGGQGGSASGGGGSDGGSGGATGGSAGSSAGGTSSGGSSTGGTSSGGSSSGGSSSGGSSGSGGGAVCTDAYGKNQSQATAFKLADMDDGSDPQKVTGKVAKGETDWYKYNGKDVFGVHIVKPNVEWTASQSVTVCIYASKDADWPDHNCADGEKVTLGANYFGCCAKSKIVKTTDFDNDAEIFVSVTRPADAVGGTACTTYDLDVKYGTGITGAPQPGDGGDAGQTP